MVRKQVPRRRRVKENIENGIAHICSTFNNTTVAIIDEPGNALSRSLTSTLGFKGSKKSTPFAAQTASETASKTAMEHGLKTVEVIVKRPGPGHGSVIRTLQSAGLEVTVIRDVTSVPHNGCHPPKCRRV